jgi:hypothetical protein
VVVKQKHSNCPECGSENVAEIIFGYPGEELIGQSERGEIVLGGCCVTEDDPEWHCNDCDISW